MIRIIKRIRSVTKQKNTAEIVENVTSCTTLLITNTFMPTGGVDQAELTVMTTMTPNQIGSSLPLRERVCRLSQ